MILGGLIAGIIDSIAGGGGMITLPILSIQTSPGAQAIGTNKIVGLTGAFIAMLVYFQFVYKTKVDKKITVPSDAFLFCVWIGIGAYIGSLLSPLLPKQFFKILLTCMCPVILWISYKRNLWVENEKPHKFQTAKNKTKKHFLVFILAITIGAYDGFFGPGGGTFMFLALFLALKFPLIIALAISKLSNTVSAGVSLASYFASGYVHVKEGLLMALGMAFGAYLGSSFTVKKASTIVRPALAVVSIILIIRLWVAV